MAMRAENKSKNAALHGIDLNTNKKFSRGHKTTTKTKKNPKTTTTTTKNKPLNIV